MSEKLITSVHKEMDKLFNKQGTNFILENKYINSKFMLQSREITMTYSLVLGLYFLVIAAIIGNASVISRRVAFFITKISIHLHLNNPFKSPLYTTVYTKFILNFYIKPQHRHIFRFYFKVVPT